MAYIAGPFDRQHLYVQWGGKLPGGEQWSCGLRMAGAAPPAESTPTEMLVGVSGAVQAYHVRAGTNLSPYAQLSFVKVNRIGVDGRYIDDTTVQTLWPDLSGGGGSPVIPPNQIALAVSLTTGYSRGPAHRGRFYLPMPAIQNVTGTGLISAATADAVSDSTDLLITALNAVNTDFTVAVMSRKSGAPTTRYVTGNQVGRVLDTQRRRRRSLVEDYQ